VRRAQALRDASNPQPSRTGESDTLVCGWVAQRRSSSRLAKCVLPKRAWHAWGCGACGGVGRAGCRLQRVARDERHGMRRARQAGGGQAYRSKKLMVDRPIHAVIEVILPP